MLKRYEETQDDIDKRAEDDELAMNHKGVINIDGGRWENSISCWTIDCTMTNRTWMLCFLPSTAPSERIREIRERKMSLRPQLWHHDPNLMLRSVKVASSPSPMTTCFPQVSACHWRSSTENHVLAKCDSLITSCVWPALVSTRRLTVLQPGMEVCVENCHWRPDFLATEVVWYVWSFVRHVVSAYHTSTKLSNRISSCYNVIFKAACGHVELSCFAPFFLPDSTQ